MHPFTYRGVGSFVALFATILPAGAQAPPASQETTPPNQGTQSQEPTLADLQARLARLEQAHADEVDDLTFEIEGLEDDLSRLEAKSGVTAQRANVFNPSITAFGNFVARTDDTTVRLDDKSNGARLDDQFNLREFELDFRAAIDPWSDGILIATYESEVPGEANATIEEGYVTLKKLPILNSAPAGLKLKIGRFREDFGRFNQIHLHDLPQPSYPRALGNFLGPEGLIRDGMEGTFFLPSPTDSQTLESTVGVYNGGGVPIAAGESRSNLAVLAHVKWFADLGKGQNVELGVSGLQNDNDHRLLGVDGTYKWKPHEAGEWNSFLLGGELYQADLNEAGFASSPMGYYLWSQYQFTHNLYLGVRYDHAEELSDTSLKTDTYGTYLTFYTTEFLRMRVGLEHSDSDLALVDGRDTALLELNFIFGSHPVEPYWVNR